MKKLLVCCKMFGFFKAIFKFCTAKKLFKFIWKLNIYLNRDQTDMAANSIINDFRLVTFLPIQKIFPSAQK